MFKKASIFVLLVLFSVTGVSANSNLLPTFNDTKTTNHVGLHPGTPDDRQGGEDISTAVVIDSLPFGDTGNTSDNVDDYDFECPYGPSTSPDVVYSFTPTEDLIISVDLCGSSYDTKTYIYDSSLNIVECNDDYYLNDNCGDYVSKIEIAYLEAGETYFIVVDGYGGDFGDYILEVDEAVFVPPCYLTCEDDEGEPEIVDGYQDSFNNGCSNGDMNFSNFVSSGNGELYFGGTCGYFFSSSGGSDRDTDWYLATIGSSGVIEWTLDAELETYGFLLGPNNCDEVGVVDTILAGPCAPLTMTIEGTPGDVVWLWIGPSTFEGPSGFVGHEYKYLCTFTGLWDETIDTEKVAFEEIKTLYR